MREPADLKVINKKIPHFVRNDNGVGYDMAPENNSQSFIVCDPAPFLTL
jgi:hypothetical protein